MKTNKFFQSSFFPIRSTIFFILTKSKCAPKGMCERKNGLRFLRASYRRQKGCKGCIVKEGAVRSEITRIKPEDQAEALAVSRKWSAVSTLFAAFIYHNSATGGDKRS